MGRGEAYIPRGRGEPYPSRGRGEPYPSRGRGEYVPSRGRGEYVPSRGRGEYVPSRGRGEYVPSRGRGVYVSQGRGEPYPSRGRKEQTSQELSEYVPPPLGRGSTGRGGRGREYISSTSTTNVIYPETVKAYFGNRNGISFEEANIREGINYTPETLRVMTPHVRADEMTEEIVKRMPYKPFIVIEFCGGIGGNTLSFLDNPNVSAVYSYESNPERRQMLKNNIIAYKFGFPPTVQNSKAWVGETEFPGIASELGGSVLFIDPPWIPTESGYAQSGIQIGPYTLEQWIERSKNAALVVIKLPLGYKLGNVPGFTCESVNLRKSMLAICRSDEGMRIAQSKSPAPTAPQPFDMNVWIQRVKDTIRKILTDIVPADQLELMLSDEAMKTWIKAFTHQSFIHGGVTDNYEKLEILGDAFLKATFIRYLMRRYENTLEPSHISALQDRYMSKVFQRQLAVNMGFQPLIRISDLKVNMSILEDVFEAFFGALIEVSDEIAEGFGYINAYNLLVYLLNPIQFNLSYAYGRSKTQIKEFFERLGWGVPIVTEMETDVGIRVIVSITPAGLAYLANRGIIIPREIGVAEAPTKKVAMHEAYDNALSNLARYGITREWVRLEKEQWDLSNPDFLPYLEAARERLRRDGYTRMYFFVPRSGTNVRGCLVQLIGVQRDTYKHVVLISIPECDPVEGKVEALRQYATGS